MNVLLSCGKSVSVSLCLAFAVFSLVCVFQSHSSLALTAVTH